MKKYKYINFICNKYIKIIILLFKIIKKWFFMKKKLQDLYKSDELKKKFKRGIWFFLRLTLVIFIHYQIVQKITKRQINIALTWTSLSMPKTSMLTIVQANE